LEKVIEKGRVILSYRNGVRDSHVSRAVSCRLAAAPQFQASIVCSSTLASEIGNSLCKAGAQMGVVWMYDHKKKCYSVSLRSDSDDVNVSLIAKTLGGGGHPRASGFSYNGASIEDLLVKTEIGEDKEGPLEKKQRVEAQ